MKEVHFTDEGTEAQMSPVGTEDGGSLLNLTLKPQVAFPVTSPDHSQPAAGVTLHKCNLVSFSTASFRASHMPIKENEAAAVVESQLTEAFAT